VRGASSDRRPYRDPDFPDFTAKKRAVMVTMVGRVDVRFDQRQPSMLRLDRFGQPFGFGNQNLYPAQLVLISVKDITLTEDGKPIR
jgi:hypothetical protein